ncbi:sphingosine kinase related protein [Heterostelium album PN500]|uniref:Sphingosine kinase related protein n=1 Tax=Heterostelium pallidum (strain ATCC 26659 / Pp 5 / PN500) TaxID=670386 RepID=D3AVS8_HETP5|nr:sphingosine kinase related protein [Heterostelium album PN500]EFA86401.1 sphingosine kinase related protein [Heterostelium album PN500]|eukprot:XP_020438506.1 sphingosine kinase related protein [Heterostelium album PN500]
MSEVATKFINIFLKDKKRMDPERVKAKAAQKLEKRSGKKTVYQHSQPTEANASTIIYEFSEAEKTSPQGADTISATRRSWSEQMDSDKENFVGEREFTDNSLLSHPSFLEPSRVKRIQVQSVAIIYNPFSGSKIGEKIMNEARNYFEVHGLTVQIIPTEYKGHAEDLCRNIDVTNVDAICLVGGDGTIHEAVNGIMKRDPETREKFVLACLPAGTGNSFVMELQGTLSIKHICERILNGLTVPIDIAKVTCVKKDMISQECNRRKMEFRTLKSTLANVDLNSSQLSSSLDAKRKSYHDLKTVRPDILMEYGAHLAEEEHLETPPEVIYSFNSLHWGLGSKVNITAEKMRWMGKAVRYTTAALLELFKGEKILARIEYEDANGEISALEDEFCLAIVNNIQGAAKGMKMAPKAKLNDGLFDLILIKSSKTFDLMNIFAKIYDGTHTELDFVIYKQVKRFSITPFKKDKERKKRLHKEKKRIKAAKKTGQEIDKTPLEILKTECNTILSELEDQIDEEIIDIDGELKGTTPFICEVLPRSIRVVSVGKI